MTLLHNFIGLFVDSAPWLILGFIVAGIIKGLIPENFLAKHLGKPGFVSTIKAALFGAPLPLCSCGVIPAALSLRRGGASKASTTSFLISTPETGVDSISISYALLGPFMAVIRPIAAIASAIVAGLLVGKDEDTAPLNNTQVKSCCAKDLPVEEEKPDCCASKKVATPSGLKHRISNGLRFTFIDLVDDISLWLLLGLGLAAVITTFVPTDFLSQWGGGFLAFVVMAGIGVPMYICATSSTPIAASLLLAGVSPGAVLVFMLVGPATNIATIGIVKQELGKRALAAYLGSVVGVGFMFGYLTNYLAERWQLDILSQTAHNHQLVNIELAYGASILLAALIADRKSVV